MNNLRISVNSTADTASPPAGAVTLRSALARLDPGGTITFDPALNGATITLSIIGQEHSILKGESYAGMTYLGYLDRDYGKSALYAAKSVTLDGSALPAGITIAWGGGDANPARVLAVYGNLTLKGVNISGGYSKAEALAGAQPYTLARGGGIAVWGKATLVNCTLSANRCLGDALSSRDRGTYGGAIYANAVDLVDCVISGNSAAGYGAAGGAVYSVGGSDRNDGIGLDSSLTRCTVSGNRVTAKHAYGGGIFSLAGGPNNRAWLRLSNCTIARNLVEDNPDPAMAGATQYYYRGGGVYMGGGSLSLAGCTVAENEVNGVAALFSGKPNMGGGGIAATIGNAHVVENVTVHHSIVAGNKLSGSAEDWFAGSLLNFTSLGYNRFGVLDFSQILVPVPDWTDLSRKHYPKVGDQEGVSAAAVLDLGHIGFHAAVLSEGTDKGPGQTAVLWYPPAGNAVDQIPGGVYDVATAVAGYTGFGAATDDFLMRVLEKLRTDYPVLGVGFGAGFGDVTGVTWYGPAVTWPTNPLNAAWIQFWRDVDNEIGDKLGMARLGDGFWASFTDGPFGNVTMDVSTLTYTAVLAASDQLGNVRPSGPLGDIGAIERR